MSFIYILLATDVVSSHTSIDFITMIRMGGSALSIIIGMLFVFAGTFGVLRLPDFYTRLHAAGITDTLGVELILLGLIIQSGFSQMSLKLLMVSFFLFLTSPTATHAVANAAFEAGLKPKLGRYKSPTTEDLIAGKTK